MRLLALTNKNVSYDLQIINAFIGSKFLLCCEIYYCAAHACAMHVLRLEPPLFTCHIFPHLRYLCSKDSDNDGHHSQSMPPAKCAFAPITSVKKGRACAKVHTAHCAKAHTAHCAKVHNAHCANVQNAQCTLCKG